MKIFLKNISKRKYLHARRRNRKCISLANDCTNSCVDIITCNGAKVQFNNKRVSERPVVLLICGSNFTSLIITAVLEALKSVNKLEGFLNPKRGRWCARSTGILRSKAFTRPNLRGRLAALVL